MDLPKRLVELLGADGVRELHGGHQSKVFEVIGPTPRMVAKVHDASLLDRSGLEMRVETMAELARIDSRVCSPLPVDGRLVTTLELDDGSTALVTCYSYANGVAPDVEQPNDVERMGGALAGLHESMRSLARRDLPLVAGLAAIQPDWSGPTQLLHGDFSTGNTRLSDGVLEVFDFDDCGYGPPAFDVANSLYMVLFDDLIARRPGTFPLFRDAFLAGYRSVSAEEFSPGEVNGFIDLRVAALESWLDEPDTAPIGIRTSGPEWLTTLRSFVDQYEAHRH